MPWPIRSAPSGFHRVANAVVAVGLAGVRDAMHPLCSREGEDFGEIARRKPRLIAAERNADNVQVAHPRDGSCRLHGGFGTEISRYVGQELERCVGPRHAQLGCNCFHRRPNVELRVEERPYRRRDKKLAVNHALRERIFHELAGQAGVILRILQRTADRGEEKEKLAKVFKTVRIGGIDRVARSFGRRSTVIAQRHAVLTGKLHEALRAQRPLEMAVEVDLRHARRKQA